MIAPALCLAALLPLGVWPEDVGPPEAVVGGVEFYTVEPEDDFWIAAVLPLSPPLADLRGDRTGQLVELARSLVADAVLLLGEADATAVPDDREGPLPTTSRWSIAVFLVFDTAEIEAPDERQVVATHSHAAGKLRLFASRI